MRRLPDPEPGFGWARLQRGPLDGTIALVPLEPHRGNLPARLVGFSDVLVLDETAETIEWTTASYLWLSGQPVRPKPGEVWVYVFAPPREDGLKHLPR